MNILFVSPYVPSPIRVRPYSFIRALARRGHAVTLVCSAGRRDGEALAAMRAVCARVEHVEIGKLDMLRNALRALPGSLPLQAALNCSPRLMALVSAEAASGRHDVAHIEHLRGSALASGLGGLAAVLDAVDCISLLFERALRVGARHAASLRPRLMALADLARTRAYEAGYLDRFARVVVSSPEDAWALQTLTETAGRQVEGVARPSARRGPALSARRPVVIPNGVDLDYFAPQPIERAPATLVFSGKMGYHANDAAALFLGREIMPLVWAHRPEVRVVIAGGFPPRAVQELATDPRVDVTGYLPDLRPAIAGATIAVCPLRYGVGIQNKVLEAMALETPVIAARQVARSISARDGQDLVLAERPEEYASAILALLDDEPRRRAIGAAGRRYVERRHSWDTAAASLETLYHAAAGHTNGVPLASPLAAYALQ